MVAKQKAKLKVKDKPKRPRGQPPKQRDESSAKMVQVLSQYGEPQEDIAARLNICVETLQKLYPEELARGKREAHTAIRKTLFEKAKEGNIPSLLFYCKTQLGMRETNRLEMTSPDGTMTPKGTTFDLSGFTPDQLADMARAAFRGE
jgi:hypothetical protein